MAKDEECFASEEVLHVGKVEYILYIILYIIYIWRRTKSASLQKKSCTWNR